MGSLPTVNNILFSSSGPDMSPLERFLGCVYMRRALQRFIQAEDCLMGIPSTEPLVVLFKVCSELYYKWANSSIRAKRSLLKAQRVQKPSEN